MSFVMADDFSVCVMKITSRIRVSFLIYLKLKFVCAIFYQIFIFSPNDKYDKTISACQCLNMAK